MFLSNALLCLFRTYRFVVRHLESLKLEQLDLIELVVWGVLNVTNEKVLGKCYQKTICVPFEGFWCTVIANDAKFNSLDLWDRKRMSWSHCGLSNAMFLQGSEIHHLSGFVSLTSWKLSNISWVMWRWIRAHCQEVQWKSQKTSN